jgi:uncharacterized BrkB/YihY/UPF0761 family membrane protein
LIARQENETLGLAFLVGLVVALVSANSGVAALFDALNVVYDEKEKRSVVRFYATTFLFTLAGAAFVILAISGVVLLPLALKLFGSATATEQAIAFLRWPFLLVAAHGQPRVCLSFWSKPARRSLALGNLGECLRGFAVGRRLDAVLVVRRPRLTATTRHTARLARVSAS